MMFELNDFLIPFVSKVGNIARLWTLNIALRL